MAASNQSTGLYIVEPAAITASNSRAKFSLSDLIGMLKQHVEMAVLKYKKEVWM